MSNIRFWLDPHVTECSGERHGVAEYAERLARSEAMTCYCGRLQMTFDGDEVTLTCVTFVTP